MATLLSLAASLCFSSKFPNNECLRDTTHFLFRSGKDSNLCKIFLLLLLSKSSTSNCSHEKSIHITLNVRGSCHTWEWHYQNAIRHTRRGINLESRHNSPFTDCRGKCCWTNTATLTGRSQGVPFFWRHLQDSRRLVCLSGLIGSCLGWGCQR